MKILQIIPAPKKMFYGYPDESDHVRFKRPVCLALAEHEPGDREVKVMGIEPYSSYIDIVDESAIVVMED